VRVLIVDDEPDIVAGLTLMLEAYQIEAEGVGDGATAEQRIAEEFFPVILADLRMRTEDEGLRLLDAVRRLSPRSRVASMTGYADAATEARLRERGAHAVLRKPFPGDELVAVLRELLAAVEAAEETCAGDDELYAATVGTLHAISRRRYGFDSGDAEDLVQETWLLYLQKRESIRTPRAWLTGAMANLCRQRIDRYHRERARAAELTDAGALPPHDSVLTVRDALSRLDPRSRALCTMIGLEQQTYDEVSAALSIPLGSIGPLYMRARKRLRQAIGG
jgi:RNA polymerase sigma factor (sigma-70 family)